MKLRRAPDGAEATASCDPFWTALVELCFGVRGWWSAICEELQLTPAQGLALRTLDPERPLAMSTLADAMACDASNVTGIVDKLESRGLIARRGADHDRRIKMLQVTDSGCALRDRLIRRLLEPPAAVLALPRELKGRLTAALRKVIEERIDPDGGAAAGDRKRPARPSRD